MKRYEVQVESISPLLMGRFPPERKVEAGRKGRKATTKRDPATEAEESAYRMPDGKLCQPGEHLWMAMKFGARFHNIGRRSAEIFVTSGVTVEEEMIPHGRKDFDAIDERAACNPNTGKRMMVYRAKLNAWKLVFHLLVDEELIDEKLLMDILKDAGRMSGIGCYRPERKGPFGRFAITSLKQVE